jgi:hypothetical protein
MPKSKSRGKRYTAPTVRNRYAGIDRLMGAMVATMPVTEADAAPFELVVLESIDCICKGIGTGVHWDRIAKAINEAWILANDRGIGEEAKPYIVVAKDSMERMKARFLNTGTMAFDGLALQAVRRAVELWRQQLQLSTVGELAAAANMVHEEFYRKEVVA